MLLAGLSFQGSQTIVQIENRPIEALIPYARNSRTHSDAQVAQIAASIREFGWTNPVLVDGSNGIIAGHGRVLAARKLGFEQVPVIELAHLSESQKRAYVLADNKLAENAGWDDELLRIELEALQAAGFDLSLTGFADDELAALMAELAGNEGLTDDDAVPEITDDPVSQPGDVWLLGEHRLLCGDATDPVALETLMGSDLADMAFTDPPYNVNYANTAKDKQRGTHRPILNDNLGEGFAGFLSAACANLLTYSKGAVSIAMSSSKDDHGQRVYRIGHAD